MLPRGQAKESAARRALPLQGLSSPGRQTLSEAVPGPFPTDGDDGKSCRRSQISIRFLCRFGSAWVVGRRYPSLVSNV